MFEIKCILLAIVGDPRSYVCQVPNAFMCVSPCGSTLGPFWVHFGSILGPFWVHFGSISEHVDYCLNIDASLWLGFKVQGLHQNQDKNQCFDKNEYLDKNQQLDKNTFQTRIPVWIFKKRVSEASKGKRAKRVPLGSRDTFGDTHENAFWCLGARPDTYKRIRIWCA